MTLQENPSSPFKVDDSELSRELKPNETAKLYVTFHPMEGGAFTEDLRLLLRGESEADVSISLTGQARTLQGEGGGCACRAGSGGTAVLGMLLLVALRARRRGPAGSPPGP